MAGAGMFRYVIGGVHYLSGRRDFWVVKTGIPRCSNEL